MNKIVLWFWLSCKRQLKRPVFVALLALLPLGLAGFSRTEKADDGKISIALYTAQDDWNRKVAEELINGEHAFEFYLCETAAGLERDVASNKAECGYIFSEGLKKMLDQGKYRRAIRLVTSPATVAAKLSNETVFAGLFKVYGRDLLKEYSETGTGFAALNEKKAEGEEPLWSDLEPLYDEYLENGSTFNFEYATSSGGIIETDSVKAVFPVRGIASVFIFVMGLSAAVTTGGDEKRGLFLKVPDRKKAACKMAQMAAPVLFSCLSAFACLLATDTAGSYGREGLMLAAYGAGTVLFSYILLRLVGDPLVLAGLIPFFIVGSLVACPVFADLSTFVPILKEARYLFPPYYYLIY